MRGLTLFVVLLLSAGPVAAQQQDPPAEAAGDLAEVMRSILFPNSNLIFDAQSGDPGAPPDAETGGDSTTARFAGIYTGWEQVENAAIALAESANLITLPRLCENVEDDPARNGEPVPIEQDDWKQHVSRLREVGLARPSGLAAGRTTKTKYCLLRATWPKRARTATASTGTATRIRQRPAASRSAADRRFITRVPRDLTCVAGLNGLAHWSQASGSASRSMPIRSC